MQKGPQHQSCFKTFFIQQLFYFRKWFQGYEEINKKMNCLMSLKITIMAILVIDVIAASPLGHWCFYQSAPHLLASETGSRYSAQSSSRLWAVS